MKRSSGKRTHAQPYRLTGAPIFAAKKWYIFHLTIITRTVLETNSETIFLDVGPRRALSAQAAAGDCVRNKAKRAPLHSIFARSALECSPGVPSPAAQRAAQTATRRARRAASIVSGCAAPRRALHITGHNTSAGLVHNASAGFVHCPSL